MSSPTVTFSTVTTVLEISDYGNGKFEIKEIKSDEASIPILHSDNRKKVDIPLPVPGLAITGYYDIDDKELGLYMTMFGTQVGTKYTAGIDSGINIVCDLWAVKGNIGIFKQGNELKGRYGLKVGVWPVDASYNDEFRIFNI